MEADLSLLPDFIIKGCIPNCKECPGTWKNECIKHRIVCKCSKCKDGDSSDLGLDAQNRHNTRDSASGELEL